MRPGTGLRNGLFGFFGEAAGNCCGRSDGFVFVFGLETFRVWLGTELDTLLLLGLSSRPRTGLRNGLFGFLGPTAGNC